jgi:hypothetical protein
MQIPDLINGGFEILGAPFIFLSIIKLFRDKEVKGINWMHVSFFTAWGFWNLFYYPHLGQWCSFLGGLGIVISNSIWLGMLFYYLRRSKRCLQEK